MPDKKRTVPKSPKPVASTPKPEKEAPAKPKESADPAAPRARRMAAKPRASKTVAGKPVVTPSGEPRLSVLMVASEAHPFATTGGLGEVAGALPDALARLGHAVTLVLPRYRGIDTTGDRAIPLELRFGANTQAATGFVRALPGGNTAVLVDVPDLYDRAGLYGEGGRDYQDNAWRFAVLSRAALEYARAVGERPSVIHAHDWQAGLVPVFQKMHLASDRVVGGVPVVFTIHNLAFQGVFPVAVIPALGLGWDVLDTQALEFWGNISYLKGGINFSERITTVSPTYAREILTPELGFGFDGVLRRRAAALSGILNGIDVERWNPAADPLVPASFTRDDLSGKARVKAALLGAAGLPTREAALARPAIGLVSRLTDQKGLDLFSAAADALMALDATWVMLGSGEPHYEEAWRRLAARFPDRVSATIGFDERMAHLIEAGADMFLMPSRFEPCGLNQMYSMRYGTVPIVRATGGLEDTVSQAGESGPGPDSAVSPRSATGFKFRRYTPDALVGALRRALQSFSDPAAWRALQQAGMAQDHSWDASAREYVKVYKSAGAEGQAR